MYLIKMNVVSNQCDSYADIIGRYDSWEEASKNLPEDEHVTEEENDGFTKWWDYSYSIEEV